MNDGRVPTGLTPTPAQLSVFAIYVRTFSQKRTAYESGLAYQTVKNHMEDLYRRLGVSSAMEAAAVLGWLRAPAEGPQECGWVGRCTRPMEHRGHHGGFRSFVKPSVSVRDA